ncbi:MAG: TraX family protein [Eubacteriales bacterium]|nr:TraX family protein [Eubacteriales bacterium]
MGFLDRPPVSLDGKTIKIIAIVTMFIDHLTCCFLEVATTADGVSLMYVIPYGEELDSFGRMIGRCAFPVFCFMIVEGFIHTKSRGRYLVRLLIFAAVSQIPFKLIFYPDSLKPHHDTIFTLLIGYLVIWGTDILSRFLLEEEYHTVPVDPGHAGADPVRQAAKRLFCRDQEKAGEKKEGRNIPALIVFMILTALLFAGGAQISYLTGCDYRYGGVGTILLLYVFYRIRPLSLLLAWAWLTVYNQSEYMAITGFWLIWCYNGKRGRQNKYFFYVFYPLHLLLLYLIRRQIFGM